MTPKHYLRFIQALALAAALPACADPAEPSPTGEADAGAADAQDGSALATLDRDGATPAADASDAAADVDASRPFSSGPIVPPELPVGFA